MPAVLVTGAARGIGKATVTRLAGSGWDVWAGVRRPEDGEALISGARDGARAGRVRLVAERPDLDADDRRLQRLQVGLEGMADALRLELAPWGTRVVIVEPAQTDTDMWQRAEANLEATVATLRPEHRELYRKHIEGFGKSIPRARKLASPPDGVAAVIETALTARRPKARYVVGTPARIQAVMAQLTPTAVLDLALRVGSGVPRHP
jgi:NAD(P)-dependent dehydrogenase (short-subunit alcohol dehydrogenase family)